MGITILNDSAVHLLWVPLSYLCCTEEPQMFTAVASVFHENTEGTSTGKASRLSLAKLFIGRLPFASFHGTH